ncbi:MAG: response regulator [Selenomonadaceae bacterium]|nr:response regulator [Selenomonadaceae bacterium]
MSEKTAEKEHPQPGTMRVSTKVLLEILMLAFALALIGFLMQNKMDELLNDTVEQSVARQAADFSVLAEERFKKELAELRYAAHYLESHPEEARDVVSNFEDAGQIGITYGLFSKNQGAIVGKSLSQRDFPQLAHAFSGESIVDYCHGMGLLFAVPVCHGDNVRYILYRLYSEDILTETFGLEEYNAESRILIRERTGQLIVPYANYSEKDRIFFRDNTIQSDFKRVRDKLASSRSAAVYSEGKQGKYFLFGADLPQTNCSMIGYVPWEAVAGSMSRIHQLVLAVVSMLLLLVATASIYLFLVQSKVMESDALREAKEIADRANHAKSDFLASMSHEIRTPINTVLGMNEMILRESHENEIRKYAQTIGSAGQSLLALINDILDFSKIESGHMKLVETAYQLDSLLYDIMNSIEPRAREKGLAFHIHVSENLPNNLVGDAPRLRQIILNLLTNAVKYTPEGSVTCSLSCTHTRKDELLLSISVTDTGIGIREEDKEHLFQEFERLDMVRNQSIEGTGLGLAITCNLLRMMNGDIQVESVYGKGSTFRVQLPQKISSGKDSSPAAENFSYHMKERQQAGAAYHASFVAPEAKVLLVDDNEMNLLVVQSLLKQTKVQVTACQSGQKALEEMEAQAFDIILLDHMMPGMDGIETLKRAREIAGGRFKDTPIIVLTANAIAGAREMFLAAGFSDYLSKPVAGADLEQMIQKYLPPEKIQPAAPLPESLPPKEIQTTAPLPEKPPEEKETSSPKVQDAHIDYTMGLNYNGGLKDTYETVLSMFHALKDEKKKKIQAAFEQQDWTNYTIFVHALKSTSLLVGCKELSEGAKALEMAGKKLQAAEASEQEKNDGLEYIRSHHEEVMSLYDVIAEEAGNGIQ